MIELVIWIVATFAWSWVVADSKISLPFRMALERAELKKVFGAGWVLKWMECVACTAWWNGLVGALLGLSPISNWCASAFFTCGSSLLLAKYIGMLDDDES